MFDKIKKLSVIIVVSIFLFSNLEAAWITNKNDKPKELLKKEKKDASEWIKLKKKEIKENKKEFKKEEKKITKEVKSWITKKSRVEYIDNINNLPSNGVYFTALSDSRSILIYGYVIPDTNSKFVDGYYQTSKGFGFLNDGKTTCKIGSSVLAVFNEETTVRISGECSNKIKFNGLALQKKDGSGFGSARSKDGLRLNFDINTNKNSIVQVHNTQKGISENSEFVRTMSPNKKISIETDGKYYALLIANSNYVNWDPLKSPKNDVEEIKKVLNAEYKFDKIITIFDGTEKDIMKGFNRLSKMTSDSDYVLIYYSGHGDNTRLNNYWIPVDGEVESGLGDWINTSEIADYIRDKIPNKHIALMSDSCYFDIKTKGKTTVSSQSLSYKKLLSRRAIMLVQSGSNEPVLDTASEEHSMFAKSFINSLKSNDNIIKMTEIIDDIILSHSGMKQLPQFQRLKAWGDSNGDFLFIRK